MGDILNDDKKEDKKEDTDKKETKKGEDIPAWGQRLKEQLEKITEQMVTKSTEKEKEVVQVPLPKQPKKQEEEVDEVEIREVHEPPTEKKKKSFLDWLM